MDKRTQTLSIIVIIVALLVVISLFFSFSSPSTSITTFEECAAAGFPIMESYPQKCAANGQTFTEQLSATPTTCTPSSRNAEACIQMYKPVCGWFDPEQIQCIRYPCAQTYSNSCVACTDSKVISWTEGECLA